MVYIQQRTQLKVCGDCGQLTQFSKHQESKYYILTIISKHFNPQNTSCIRCVTQIVTGLAKKKNNKKKAI